ncbi:hypothetical protein KF840_18985 [bacterium]|nr:hypothetical protein [bacterium]
MGIAVAVAVSGLDVQVQRGVLVGRGVRVGRRVLVGRGVLVGRDVLVGRGVLVGRKVFVGVGVLFALPLASARTAVGVSEQDAEPGRLAAASAAVLTAPANRPAAMARRATPGMPMMRLRCAVLSIVLSSVLI